MSRIDLRKYILNKREAPNHEARRRAVERNLINAESSVGRTVFGRVQPGHTREFFCLKKNVWIWHEDGITIRYEVRKNGVYKRVENEEHFHKIEGAELQNFTNATKAYLRLIKQNVYKNNY